MSGNFRKNPENARIVTLSGSYCDFLKFSIPYWEIVFFFENSVENPGFFRKLFFNSLGNPRTPNPSKLEILRNFVSETFAKF